MLNSNDKFTGVTIHIVDNNYDTGLIIVQETIKIEKNDTAKKLSIRVLQKEYELYAKVVKWFCDDKIIIKKNRVFIEAEN